MSLTMTHRLLTESHRSGQESLRLYRVIQERVGENLDERIKVQKVRVFWLLTA